MGALEGGVDGLDVARLGFIGRHGCGVGGEHRLQTRRIGATVFDHPVDRQGLMVLHIRIKRLIELFAAKRIEFICDRPMFLSRLVTQDQTVAGLLQQVELRLLIGDATGRRE